MSLSSALFNAVSGLQTNQSALSVTSRNITNANTDGYTRKAVDQVSKIYGSTAGGVSLTEAYRTVDSFLVKETRRLSSEVGHAAVINDFHNRLQDFFGRPGSETGLAAHLDALGAALQEMSVTPEGSAERRSVVDSATLIAQSINTMASQIQNLRLEAERGIGDAVNEINTLLSNVAELNDKITRLEATGRSPADLQDERDRALGRLSELMDVKTYERANGSMVVYTSSGRVLVDGVAKTLEHTTASGIGPEIGYPGTLDGITINGVDISGEIKGGELAGLMEMRDETLPAMQAQLDNLTQMLRDTVNAAHNQGTGLPAANSLNGTRLFDDPAVDAVTLGEEVRIAITDSDGLVVGSFEIPAGTHTVQQIADLINAQGGPGGLLDGLISAVISPEGALQIEASDPNHGVAIADMAPQTISDGTGEYSGFSHFFGLNDFFVTPGVANGAGAAGIAQGLTVRADIAGDPQLVSRGSLSTADPLEAGAIAVAPGDNSIADALGAAFTDQLQIGAAGGLPETSNNLSGYAAEIISNAAVKAQRAESTLGYSQQLQMDVASLAMNVSGVNIDEELSNMIIYQNAYAASARVISTVQEMFDVLISIRR